MSTSPGGSIAQGGFLVLDASLWVARLVSLDVFHHSVVAWMEGQRSAGMVFLSPAILLAEAAGAIARRTGSPALARQAVARLESLPGLRLVALDRSLVRKSVELAGDLGLRGADSFYVAVAARLQLPLVTLDADQKARAAAAVSVQTMEIGA